MSFDYPNAIVKGKKGKLIPQEQIKTLAKSRTIEDVKDILGDTAYGRKIEHKTKYKEMDRALREIEMKEEFNLLKLSPPPLKDLFKSQVNKWNLSNFKKALSKSLFDRKYKYFEIPNLKKDILETIAQTVSLQDLEDIIKQSKYPDLGEIIDKSENKHEILSESSKLLEKKYHKNLMEKAQEQGGTIEEYFGTKMDIKNIETILRAVKQDIPREIVEENLVPYFEVDSNKIDRMLRNETIEETLKVIKDTKYGKAIEEKKDLSIIKTEMRKMFKNYSKKIYLNEVLGAGVLLGYLTLKKFEIKNLRKILRFKTANRSEEELIEILVT